MKTQNAQPYPIRERTRIFALAGVVSLAVAAHASPPTVLVRDNFDAATPNNFDLNVDIARQTGTLAPVTYSMAFGPGHYGHQLQNGNAPNQLLVADFGNSTSSLNVNFNGANSAGGLIISFDLDSVPTVYGGTSDNWGCINLGMSQADQLANVNQGVPHFGILFRAAGTLQAFDAGAVVNPTPEPTYTTRPPGTTNHIDLVITDADGNPFDGAGNTTIEVFVNGGGLPVWSFTKAGGYANNYINVQGSWRAHFDNLTIARLPADLTPGIVNPSFEADTFVNGVGYVNQNGPITGWNALGGHGLNPGTFGAPFLDNGAIPDGQKVALLQEDGALSQVITGFRIGSSYQIQYSENGRICCSGTAPFSEVKIGGQTIVDAHAVTAVGGSNPYHRVTSRSFVATATAMQLEVIKSNPQGGDTTLFVDNFGIVQPNTPPSITTQPQDLVVGQGESAVFTVSALGSAPLSYQWYFGSDSIPGANDRTLTVLADFPDVAGNYSVVVANSAGSVTSRVARLTILDRVPGVFNTGVDDAGVGLPDGSSDTHYKLIVNPDNTGDTPVVQNSAAFPIVTGPWVPNNAGSKWIGPRFDTAPSAGGAGVGGDYTYRTLVDLSGFDPASVTITGDWATDNAGLDILVNGQSTGQGNTVEFTGFTPFTIHNGLLAGVNTIDFKLNNAGVGWTGLRVDRIRALGTALPPGTRPAIVQQPQSVNLPLGQQVSFSVRASGSSPLSYQWYFGPDALPGATGPTLSFLLDFPDLAGPYSVEVASPFGSVRSAVATLTVREAPAITTQPQSQVVAVGDPVTFSVSADGAQPFTYQWIKDGTAIPGADTATLSLSSVTAADRGTYTVRISNFAGVVTSDGAVLTVLEAIPGLFNTGVDASGAALADGAVDPHYRLVVNPDSASSEPIVEDSSVFPIAPNGPWVANEPDSKWIGPRFNTVGAAGAVGAGGDYTYRVSFDLTGHNPATVRVTGEWATDNEGLDIVINGTPTGQRNTGQFAAYTAFTIGSGFVAGVNQIEFKLNNSAVGYTGLRVRKIRALGSPANTCPQVQSQTVTLNEDTTAAITLGATDADGDPLTYTVGSPAHGTLSGTPPNLTYTPTLDYCGPDSFTFKVNDGECASAEATVSIQVACVNENPVARVSVSPLVDLGTPSVNLLVLSVNNSNACVTLDGSGSTDEEPGVLEYAWFVDGSAVPVATGAVAPACLEVGVHQVTLVVTDADGGTGSASVTVEVITGAEAIDELIEAVNDADLGRKNKRPLIATLKATSASFDRGNTHSALGQLQAFQNKVRAQVGKIDPALAMEWIRVAQSIANAVSAQLDE